MKTTQKPNPKPRRKKKWFHDLIRKRVGLTVNFRLTSIPGTWALECVWDHVPLPVGTVWFQWTAKEQISILNSYVPEAYRRLGVRTFLHETLISRYGKNLKIIHTQSGTEFSKPWLVKMGFRKTKSGEWTLEVPEIKTTHDNRTKSRLRR